MASTTGEHNFNGRLDVAVRSLLAPTEGGRTENQDNYLIIDAGGNARFLKDQKEIRRQMASWPAGHCRFAILDGMGGHSYGREATELTVEGLLKIAATDDLDKLSGELDKLHLQLHHHMHKHGSEPGCTLTMLEIPPSGPALLFHAGDSRLYVVDSDKVNYLTIDHVPATKFALFGLLDADEWQRQTHELSGFQISQAFILGNSMSTKDLFGDELDERLYELHDGNLPPFLKGLGDRRSLQLQPGRTYLLASDGLWHLSKPLDFVARWPALLNRKDRPLTALLNDLFVDLINTTAKETRLRGDNSTAIAIRLLS
jgi:serine/threonine protein phosphatase PrpC